MATETLPSTSVDLRAQEAGLRQCLGAPLIKWRHADVPCMEFHRNGRPRREWDAMWSKREDGCFRWDHVIRAQMTPKAQEFVMIRLYRSADDFEQTRGLPFRRKGAGYRRLIQIGHDLVSDTPLAGWYNNSPDYALRLAVVGWRRHIGICGRVLLAFDCTGPTDRTAWQTLISQTHKQYGLREGHALSKRVFHYFLI